MLTADRRPTTPSVNIEARFNKGFILVLYASGMLWGQVTTATISGTVGDEVGAPLGGVQISVKFLAPNRDFVGPTRVAEAWSGPTREEGEYIVPNLPLGTYQVEASLTGFENAVRWVPLRTRADEVVLDFTLKATELVERVRGKTALSGLQSGEQIDEPAPGAIVRSDSTDVERSRAPTEPPPTNQLSSTSTRGVGFAVQIAASRTRQKAEELRTMWQDRGYTVFVVEADVPGLGRYYRVRVGPFDTQEEAGEVTSNMQSRFPQEIPEFWIVPYQE